MYEIKDDPQMVEKAFLVGIQEEGVTTEDAQDHLEELASLTDTMGVPVVGQTLVRLTRPQPHFLVGEGKAEEIKMLAQANDADVIIFDFDLSPSQQRNWEKFTDMAVIDRQEVILDIFAGRAQTREARLQVGLARMQYSLPRLRRAWTHLERQRGGAGHKGGPGELQLEVDRRIVMERIDRFRRQLKEVRRQRTIQRKSRSSRPVPTAAIVGYTNAGKSSLLRALSGAEVFIEDKLFATLDPTTRRIMLANNQPLLLTDTVGFIRKLPHGLVEAFKSTLEEAVEADYLIHVIDITHPKLDELYRVTNQVLEELGMLDKKTIYVLNKVDLPHDPFVVGQFRQRNPLCFPVSTHSGQGLDALREAFSVHCVLPMQTYILRLSASRYDVVSLLHREGQVLSTVHEGDEIFVEAQCPVRFEKQLEPFLHDQMPAPAGE